MDRMPAPVVALPLCRRERQAKSWRTEAALALGVALCTLAACEPYTTCPSPEDRHADELPAQLSETGLFAASGELAPGVFAYQPRFELYSDGATKRRWLALPPDTQIDVRDPDNWQFPAGTRVWKEFTRDGVRVETRLLQKRGPDPGDWLAVAYLWRADGSDADAALQGAQNVRGTPHDVPDAGQCWACHGGRKSGLLGVSYLQLAFAAEGGGLDVARLNDAGQLSGALLPDLTLPGNATDRAALGYLHANCGHCHNQDRPESSGPRCYDPDNNLDFWLRASRLRSVRATPAYSSAVSQVIEPGIPQASLLIHLVSRRGAGLHMPPLASEQVDAQGVELLRAWIEQLN
jgi:cytochrome c553